jgi:hypothetical protein
LLCASKIAFTPADADTIFEAQSNAFYRVENGKGWHTKYTDGGGFNGIGVRWIARFMKDQHEQATFEPWLEKNAEAAWQARRAEDNLSWCKWQQPTPPGLRFSWGCSNAVVIMQAVRPPEPKPAG